MQTYYEKYLKYKAKYLNLRNSNLQTGGSNSKATIYLFKAEWCGHCKGFKPTWEKIQNDLKGKYDFITIDSDKDKEQISQWGIKGFPTIIKKVNDKAEEFVGPRDELSVKEFIEKS
jgi:thioredoxin-like negative regulator of GroEL